MVTNKPQKSFDSRQQQQQKNSGIIEKKGDKEREKFSKEKVH